MALRAVAAASAVVALAGAGAVVTTGDDGDERSASLLALTKVPVADRSLELLPAEVGPAAERVALGNRSGAPVAWEATADAAWLEVAPPQGRLEPGGEQVLVLRGSPPEGDVRTSVRVTGDDGSATMVAVVGTVEHPPDLGATASGCRVTADVEDESDVVLTLHWRVGGIEATAAMSAPADAKSFGSLPTDVAPLTWWVSAIDGRGNQARTPDVALATPC